VTTREAGGFCLDRGAFAYFWFASMAWQGFCHWPGALSKTPHMVLYDKFTPLRSDAKYFFARWFTVFRCMVK
jgi:hypothetical protein